MKIVGALNEDEMKETYMIMKVFAVGNRTRELSQEFRTKQQKEGQKDEKKKNT